MSAQRQPTPQEIQALQGTRLSDKAPWETYDEQMTEKLDPRLEAAVEEYSQHRHDKSSAQNEEELARWKEGNDAGAKEYQWCTPEEYADIQARFGRIIHSSELIATLRTKCKVKCWYREHPQPDKVTLVIQQGDGILPPEVGCWVQKGFMPEYTVMGFDDHGIPLAEKYRGWRTVLLQLILKGVLTEEKAHRIFGAAERSCAERYNSILWGFRNTYKD
jgi:hypothetical protein